MLDAVTTQFSQFSHVKHLEQAKPVAVPWRGDGLRDFIPYQDLGIEQITASRLLARGVRTGPGNRDEHRRREFAGTVTTQSSTSSP